MRYLVIAFFYPRITGAMYWPIDMCKYIKACIYRGLCYMTQSTQREIAPTRGYRSIFIALGTNRQRRLVTFGGDRQSILPSLISYVQVGIRLLVSWIHFYRFIRRRSFTLYSTNVTVVISTRKSRETLDDSSRE